MDKAEEVRINAMLQALGAQRNAAMDQVCQSVADNAMLHQRIAELEESAKTRIAELGNTT